MIKILTEFYRDVSFYLPEVIYLLIVLFSILMFVRHGRLSKIKAKQIAQNLGFVFSDKLSDDERIESGYGPDFLDFPLAHKPWKMEGIYKDISVKIHPCFHSRRNTNKVTIHTQLNGFFVHPLDYGFIIGREDFFSKIKKVFGGTDITTGDATFDKAILVKGQEIEKIKSLLEHPEVRQSILKIFDTFPDLFINDKGIHVYIMGIMTDENLYRKALDEITQAVKVASHIVAI